MTISVRLDRKTEALLDRLAREAKRTKSAVIRESIRVLARDEARRGDSQAGRPGSAYEKLKPYLGIISDGTLLKGDWRARIAEDVRRKHRAASAR